MAAVVAGGRAPSAGPPHPDRGRAHRLSLSLTSPRHAPGAAAKALASLSPRGRPAAASRAAASFSAAKPTSAPGERAATSRAAPVAA